MGNGNPVPRVGNLLDDSERRQEERGETWRDDRVSHFHMINNLGERIETYRDR